LYTVRTALSRWWPWRWAVDEDSAVMSTLTMSCSSCDVTALGLSSSRGGWYAEHTTSMILSITSTVSLSLLSSASSGSGVMATSGDLRLRLSVDPVGEISCDALSPGSRVAYTSAPLRAP